jgi:beta-lactamase class A
VLNSSDLGVKLDNFYLLFSGYSMRYFFFVMTFCALYAQTSIAEISLFSKPVSYPSLWESDDPVLQQELEKLVKKQGLWKPVQSKHLSLVLVDISDLKNPKLAQLNGNKMFYAASLPKIAILLGAFVEIEAGHLQDSDELYEQMIKMIRYSDNKSASYVLSLVGGKRIIEIIQAPDFALYDRRHNGGLWLGKAYAKGPAYQRDPLYNLSHGATAIQAARFYYLLETNQLVSPEYSKKMKVILSRPGIKHKFVKHLSTIPGIEIYRKSGSWKNYHADSTLVEYKDYKYIIIGLSDSTSGGKWLEKLALPIHQLVTDGEK